MHTVTKNQLKSLEDENIKLRKRLLTSGSGKRVPRYCVIYQNTEFVQLIAFLSQGVAHGLRSLKFIVLVDSRTRHHQFDSTLIGASWFI